MSGSGWLAARDKVIKEMNEKLGKWGRKKEAKKEVFEAQIAGFSKDTDRKCMKDSALVKQAAALAIPSSFFSFRAL